MSEKLRWVRRPRTRANAKEPVKKLRKRRRCDNCHKLYRPTRDDQKFCRDRPDPDRCRKEYYRYGSSYGPLRTGLHKAIDKKYEELKKVLDIRNTAIVIRFREISDALARLEVRIAHVERNQADAKPQAG